VGDFQPALLGRFQPALTKGEYLLERRFLKDWQLDGAKWEASQPVERVAPVSGQQIEPLALYLLDAKRDIADDLRNRISFWSKMVEDQGLSAADVQRVEDQLSEINRDIVGSSDVFTHVESHLREFHETLSCAKDSIAITPLARHLRDLSRGMDVVMSTRGAPAFPLQQQGMGTRSLGTFFSFWAFTAWRQKQAKTDALHPMMALEEPETHLHPQAQRVLSGKSEECRANVLSPPILPTCQVRLRSPTSDTSRNRAKRRLPPAWQWDQRIRPHSTPIALGPGGAG
jgi:putative ATP-dependent endonuclease of OLD family